VTTSASRPRHDRGAPVAVLCVAVIVPAVVLLAAWRWADDRSAASEDPVPAPATSVAPPAPAPALATPLQSLRRAPAALTRDVNLAQFGSSLQPLLAAVNERSCLAVSVDGVEVGATNPDLAVVPGSVVKLLVAAAALELLGEDHTFTTRVLGAVEGGVVQGDLALVGGGDPLLAGDWYPTSNLDEFAVFGHTSLDQLADAVVAAGVTSVSGRVVGDGTRYDEEWYAPGWGNGVAGVEAGPYDALLANDARVRGEELRASDPNEAAAREFALLLAERGVTIAGEGASGTVPVGTPEIAAVASQPLPTVIAEMLTNSDNNTAEMLLKELGLASAGTGTRAAGLEAVRGVLEGWGVDLTGVVLADGSGLALDNRLTCRVLLEALQRTGATTAIGRGLPVAGRTGTLQDAFVDGPAEGRLLGKTGTLNNPPFNADPPAVKSLAGYLPVEGGNEVEFALMLNGSTISDQSEYRPVWDLLAEVLTSFPAGPAAAVLGPR
jgi:D-alanyl-D-alanine carboxypeptidase/D-alanyl-D-alanine-endopeptidase (penicillin-binding protein 4)